MEYHYSSGLPTARVGDCHLISYSHGSPDSFFTLDNRLVNVNRSY
jgi:hypothetical protein